jgi:hypothetical protein
VPIKNAIAGIQTTRLPVDIITTPHRKATGLFLIPARLESPFLEQAINMLAFLPQFCYLLFSCMRK